MTALGGSFKGGARPLLFAGIAALVGVGTGVVLDIATSGGDASGSRSGAHDAEQAEAPTTTEPVALDELLAAVDVVETGITAADRQYCQNAADQDTSDGCYGCNVTEGCATRPPHEEHLVSYAMTVHNGSDHLLENIPLTLTFLNASGQPIGRSASSGEIGIGRLLPGETLGLADIVDVDGSGTAEIAVEVGPAPEVGPAAEAVSVDYARATADLAGLYELTASEIDVSGPEMLDADGEPVSEWSVDFQLEGSLPDDVTLGDEGARLFATPQVIYRDANDRIVGGSHGNPIEIDATAGYSGTTVHNYYLAFPGLDPSRTEVYFTDLYLDYLTAFRAE